MMTEDRVREIVSRLATAYGGWSQMPTDQIGMALVGHRANQGLIGGDDVLAALAADILDERWTDDRTGIRDDGSREEDYRRILAVIVAEEASRASREIRY